jgi:hypothetical protein
MIERRVDHARRKRVSEMSREEMRQALLVSEKTRLPNKRAFDECEPSPLGCHVRCQRSEGIERRVRVLCRRHSHPPFGGSPHEC